MSKFPAFQQKYSQRPQDPRSSTGQQMVSVLGPDYLKNGYFTGEKRPKEEIITSLALAVAKELKQSGMTTHQVRNIFNKVMYLKRRLESGLPFEDIRWRIQTLLRDVANAVGKKNAPEKFKTFIEANVKLATKDADSFRYGFVEHFQSVVAFLKYLEEK